MLLIVRCDQLFNITFFYQALDRGSIFAWSSNYILPLSIIFFITVKIGSSTSKPRVKYRQIISIQNDLSVDKDCTNERIVV